MIRVLLRAAAAGLIGALAGPAWLALAYGLSPTLRFDFDVTPPGKILRGVYPAEREPDAGRTFAWTHETLTIEVPDIDRQVDWTMQMRVRHARAANLPIPSLEFFVDGVLVATRPSTLDYEDVEVPIPQRQAQNGLTLAMRASPPFVPGPGDPRALGVMLDTLSLVPSDVVLPPRTAFAGVAIASAAGGIMISLLGVTAGTAVGGAVVLSAALAALIARGFGPYTDYALVVARTTTWIAVGTLLVFGIAAKIRRQPLRNTARFAVAFSAAACLLELVLLLHPNMPIGDALFHAHRFQDVVAGNFYFTSIAPGNYRFPYAPGLYVIALPFASLVDRGNADMTLLRAVVCVANALAGLLLYAMAVRVRGDRLAGALAVALYHLTPLVFGVIAVGNLTNAFAQSMAIVALALMATPGLRLERRGAVVALTAALTAAFLSHTGAFAIVSVAAIAIAIAFWWRGGPALRSPAAAVAIAAVVSAIVAVVVYYAHFADTYRTELARIGAETASAAPDAGGRGIADRLATVPAYLRYYIGIPTLALMLWGAAALWQRGARDRVTLAAIGWLATCAAFLVLGIVTPVDMRHYLAAIPAIAVIAAAGGAIAWSTGTLQRIAAAALLSWAVYTGVHAWWSTLG